MRATQESLIKANGEESKKGKMMDGSHVGMKGFYNVDPAYFRDYGERAGLDLIDKDTTLINEVVFTGQEEPYATLAMGGADLDIPTETDLGRILQSADLPDASSLVGSRVEVFKWGAPESLIPFGVNVLPREETSMTASPTAIDLIPGVPVVPTPIVAA